MQSNPTKTSTQSGLIKATCSACGLLCDDILFDVSAQTEVAIASIQCKKSIQFFSHSALNAQPKKAGNAQSLTQAVTQVANLLNQAKTPILTGLSTDLAGFRAAYQFAQKTHARMMHMNATSTLRNTKVLQSTGWQTTTLTEVKNRADMIVCIGTDVVSHNPRFFERVVWSKEAMFVTPNQRNIVYLGGEQLDTAHGVSPLGQQPTVLPCAVHQLPEVTAALRALLQGKLLKETSVAGISIKALEDLVGQLKQAKYAVLIWVAKDLDFPHAELTIQNITESVVVLNQQSRAMGLALGGSDGDTTVNYAHTWLNGLTLKEEDITQHDVVVWVNSFSPEKPMPAFEQPVIAIGHPNMTFNKTPDVFIPVATPGLDMAGTLFRVDSSVVLPLKKVLDSNLPTLAAVLAQIEAQLT